MDFLNSLVGSINDFLWTYIIIVVLVGCGLWFTLSTKLVQLCALPEMVRLLTGDLGRRPSGRKAISSFQAFCVSTASRVGVGNIAGVAIAIVTGGPGAVFWMWVVAFLGASTAYVESTLGQIYKVHDKDAGMYLGGPAYYFERCLGWRWYGILFAVAATFACGLFLIGPQANGVASAMVQIFGEGQAVTTGIAGEVGSHRLIATACVLVLLSFIIFGGIRRIASFAQVIVPFMALAYIVLAMIIVFININRVPELLALIVSDAFNPAAGFGAAIGMGVKRGIYSNEAGQGTGAHAAAAAAVEHPVQQGLVQAFSVYIDTLFVCTATALIILMTKQYNIVAGQHFAGEATQYIATYLKDASGAVINADPGTTAFTQYATASVFGKSGPVLVALATFFFAFTTILAYYYIAETNILYLARKFGWERDVTLIVKLSAMLAVTYGAVGSAGYIWKLGDIGVGLNAWLNIVGLVIIFFAAGRPTIRALRDYERQQKEKATVYTFDPQALGIKHATFWEERIRAEAEKTKAKP